MTRDPWRPQAIGDAMTGRDTTPQGPFIENPNWVDISSLDVIADEVYAIAQPRQIVLWPMLLHVHDQECWRA